MEDKPARRSLLDYNPPVAELVFAFFGLAVLYLLFGFYLEYTAAMEVNASTRQIYLIQFDQPALGPDNITTRYGTFTETVIWRTLNVAMDMTLLLGLLAMLLALLLFGLRKARGR